MEITHLETIPIELPVKTRDEPFGVGPYIGGNLLRNLPESLTYEEALAANEEATEGARKLLIRLTVADDVTGWGEIRVPSMRVGKAIVEDLLKPAVVGRSIDRIEEFVDELETIEERGVAFDDEERIEGMRCVAAPILRDGPILGGISITGPKKRIKDDRFRNQLPDKLQETARIIELSATYDRNSD